jgi:hypothetical protein
MTEGGFPHCLHGGACAREEFEVKDKSVAFAAHSSQLADCVNLSAKAVVRRTILEFEFLSRKNRLHAINEMVSPRPGGCLICPANFEGADATLTVLQLCFEIRLFP